MSVAVLRTGQKSHTGNGMKAWVVQQEPDVFLRYVTLGVLVEWWHCGC
jgi:hypothetical protein